MVDAASIAVNRRRRRAKTDRIDVEALLRSLMAWARGERAVSSMVRAPSPEEEDARRLTREREMLIVERVSHVNRIKGLLATQGVFVFEPIRKDRRQAPEKLRRWDGEVLPPRLNATLLRELDRLELVMSQIAGLEAERDRELQTDDAVRGKWLGNRHCGLPLSIRPARNCCACGVLGRRLLRCSPSKRLSQIRQSA